MLDQPHMAEAPALVVENVSHSYGRRRALDDVSFAVAPGTFTVLLGLNGAGKSTLFSLVTRLFPIRRGRIRIFGHDVSAAPGQALRRMGVVFQPRTLDLDLSVMQNLVYHAALHGIRPGDAKARAAAELARIGLASHAGDKVRALSGGQMRRVEIARALLHGPRLLVLDEPTVGLDIKARVDLLGTVRGLVARQGVTAIWATHLMDEAGDADGVIVLHHGRVLAHGSCASVLAQAGAADIGAAFTTLALGAAAAVAEP